MKYSDNIIKESIVDFLGEEGNKYFRELKEEHDTCWVREDIDGWSISNWTTETMEKGNRTSMY